MMTWQTRAGITFLAAVICAAAADEKPIFRIGWLEGSAMEFGLTRERWRQYKRIYPKPIVFRVGKSRARDWPYIHPGPQDGWAGKRVHTFTIHFRLKGGVSKPCFLHLALADAHRDSPPLVTVGANGREVSSQRAPKGVGVINNDLRTWGKPATLTFQIPSESLQQGENTTTVRLDDGSWIVYDFIELNTTPKPPQVETVRDDLLQALDVDEIVFAVRKLHSDGHWYANFSYYANNPKRLAYRDGTRLQKLNLRTGKLATVLEDPKGGVRDPQVHYDGKKILFSYRKGGSPYYHLYEINVDGTGLRQLTDGPNDDLEPTYLPDGDILFCSSRCNRWVNCWYTHVAVLYRCDGGGGNIRMVSSNNEHDNTPWMLPDGRVLYTRWEYVDRSQVRYHHLWVINPDGTSQMTYYGNMHAGTVMIDAKPVPGTQKVLASFSPGHGRKEHDGYLTVVDPNAGPDERSFAKRIHVSPFFRDPYPLSADRFLAVRRSSILMTDSNGAVQTVYELPENDVRAGFQCHEPRPIRSRPREPRVPSRPKRRSKTGCLALVDVTHGRKMAEVKRGEIKRLLVLETLPKPVNFSGGMEPLSMGGTFTLPRMLGTVPVEPDGSAYLEVPALRSLYFVALDENDLSVKRMQSFVTVQPGETTACAGCHENRQETPKNLSQALALRRPPSRITPIADVPDVFDFPRDIQPILDKHCLKCHDYDKRCGGVILSGDRGPMYSHSYYTLNARRQTSDGRNRDGNRAPRTIGSSASPLMKKIGGEHHDVKVSEHEHKMIRLWIETGATYPGTYAALGTGMLWSIDQRRDRRRKLSLAVKACEEAIKRRCGSCHVKQMSLPLSPFDSMGLQPRQVASPRERRAPFHREIVFNLTRPEKSVALLAPLARTAGGYGMLRKQKLAKGEAKPERAELFNDADDPDYQKILAVIREAKQQLDRMKRFDMPGFVPNQHYVREMKRYGVLAKDSPASAPIDVYAVDQAYWRSFWWSAN